MKWNDLTMSQRAEVIQMAVKNGMRDLNQIRSFYDGSVNKFAMGGPEETIVTPSDNTKVNYQPSVYVGDSKEVQDALNAKIAAEGKAAYATGRFLPYIKYATDVVDWTSGDPTDAIQMAGNAIQLAGNRTANMYQGKSIGNIVKIGHRNHLRATKLTPAMVDDAKAFGRLFSKMGNIVAFPGLVGDVIQSYRDYENLIEAEKNYNNASTKVFNERVKTHPAVKIGNKSLAYDGHKYGGEDEETQQMSMWDKVKENAYQRTRPLPTAIDRALYFADVMGAPSHVTNALRDVSNRAANEPVIMANAAYNFLTGKGNLKESYKQADINPSPLFQLFEVKPKLNTEANYSQKELAAMDELSRRSQSSEVGQITHKGYKAVNAEKYNEGRYAGDISLGNFFAPSKVVEWSLGQTSGKKEKNDNYTTDNFAYDTKDTRHVYLSSMRHGKASPAMWLRGVLGVQGSKGYDKGDSATTIRSKVSVKAQQKANKKGSWAYGGSLNDDLFAYGGPMGTYYDGWGDIGNWLKQKAKAGKRYIEKKATEVENLGEAALEDVKATVSNFIAENLLEDVKRKEAYAQAKEKASTRLDEAIKRFKGEKIESKTLDLVDIDPSERGIKPNAYNQFNLRAPKKTREDYISDLQNMSEEELKGVQRQLADAGLYDQELSGGKNYIRKVQQNLIRQGYLPKGEDDGYVGPKTQKAYNQYIRDMNVDGKLGNRTIEAYLGRNMNSNVSTKGIDGCAQWTTLKYESMADGRSLQNGVIGNAWQMPKNIESKGGSILYNIYDDAKFKNISGVQDLKSKTVQALKEHPLDYSQLQIGDIVGIYMPSSNMHEIALRDGTTKNTHVGIVTGFNKDGVPIVEHNIHQSHRTDLITNLSGSKSGKAQVTTVARPAQVNVKVDVKETQWDEATSKFQIDKKYQNKSINSFANSMAGIAPQIQKLYPDVDIDSVQEIALAVQKRETNFMTNNTSKQGLLSKFVETVGDKYREFKGQTEFSKSSDLAKMKMSALTENERKFLGIHSKADMENPKKAGAAAALYLARNMNYLQNVRKMNPALDLTDEDIYNLTILSYNQDITDLGFKKGKLSQEEIDNIRQMYDPKAKIKDVNSTKYKHLGILGDVLYEKLEDGFTPYIGAARDAAAKYITKK